MPVHVRHKAFKGKEYAPMRTAFAGQYSVKDAGTEYLPKTGGMLKLAETDTTTADAMYSAYKQRAEFSDILSWTVFGQVGLAHKTPWEIQLPARMEYLRERATQDGKTLDALTQTITPEVLVTGRYGLFADIHDETKLPIIKTYCAEAIINWKEVDQKLTRVVLEELVEDERSSDRFSVDEKVTYRVLEIDEFGTYFVEEHAKTNTEASDQSYHVDMLPKQSLQKKRIPFHVAGSQSITISPDKIPLQDMAMHLFRAYELSADLGHALHMVAQPTYHAYGVTADEKATFFGAGAAVYYSNEKAKAEFVEISGAGIGAIQIEIERQIKLAKAHSHELQDMGSSESGNALGKRVESKTATLRSVVINGANALEETLRCCADWLGADRSEVVVSPSLSFSDAEISAEIISAFDKSIASNTIPREILWKYLREVKAIEELDDDEIEGMLDKQMEEAEARSIGMLERTTAIESPDIDNDDDDKEPA